MKEIVKENLIEFVKVIGILLGGMLAFGVVPMAIYWFFGSAGFVFLAGVFGGILLSLCFKKL
jgi:hypothetical protein